MEKIMKDSIIISFTAASLLVTSTGFAHKAATDSELLGRCKNLVNNQIQDVKKMKLSYMKNTLGKFKAKLRFYSNNDKGIILCSINRGELPTIARLDKPVERLVAAD